MDTKTVEFLKEKFRDYYLKNLKEVSLPSFFEKREFGFVPFRHDKVLMVRHKGFKSFKEFSDFMINLVPSDVYYSSAYYKNPSEEKMNEKGWLGADLIFDIDCDDIQDLCRKSPVEHKFWKCLDCGETFSENISLCSTCGGSRIEEDYWLCEFCLNKAKDELLKLFTILEEDFAIHQKNMTIVFSGHRGYHLHVEDEAVMSLGADERKEIVDYIRGVGLDFKDKKIRKKILSPLNISKPGFQGRISRAVYDLLVQPSKKLLENGLDEKTAKKINEKRSEILTWLSNGVEEEVLIRILGSEKKWIKIVEKALTKVVIPVDTVVTTDIHRLIRLPGTLHGKTGLKTVVIPINMLEEFDPLTDGLAFKDEKVRIKVKISRMLRFNGEIFKLSKGEMITLPSSVAIFLLARGVASLT
ncbi:MAG: DNA primase small subunit domain-containing protein [Candidatus Bathyarchaeota archaeon]